MNPFREHIPVPPIFGLTIDTDAYAGNFEREAVAYMTGQVGDCGIGRETALQAIHELDSTPEGGLLRAWCAKHTLKRPDGEHGIYRPSGIAPTPGWFNNGHGSHFQDGDPIGEATTVRKWPAYQSVVTWFDAEPPPHIHIALATRAHTFLSAIDKNRGTACLDGVDVLPVTMLGSRIIQE